MTFLLVLWLVGKKSEATGTGQRTDRLRKTTVQDRATTFVITLKIMEDKRVSSGVDGSKVIFTGTFLIWNFALHRGAEGNWWNYGWGIIAVLMRWSGCWHGIINTLFTMPLTCWNIKSFKREWRRAWWVVILFVPRWGQTGIVEDNFAQTSYTLTRIIFR